MGNLRACFAVALLALAACGSDNAKTDAGIVLIDSPSPDAKVYEDAPPPMYDLSCLNAAAPTTAPANITISGTTSTLGMNGTSPVPSSTVDVFKVGNATDTVVGNATSDSTSGAFSITDIPTGGAPINGYVRGVAPPPAQGPAIYRSTYMFPGTVVATDLTGVPVILISTQAFTMISGFAGATQDDDNKGALLVQVIDCAGDSIDGANLVVEQNGGPAGQVFDLGQFVPGTFFAFNVPDGETQVKVSFDGMNFPTRVVKAFKKPTTQGAEGTISAVQVTPRN